MTIEEFIEARIAEAEEAALEAADDGHDWLAEEETISLWPDDREPCDGFMTFPRKAHAYHATIHSPARVLRQCAAMRATVAYIEAMVSPSQQIEAEGDVLRPIAAIWSDHPDYLQEWAR